MVCPYKENYNCPFVDTAVMDKTIECRECEIYWVEREDAIKINGSVMMGTKWPKYSTR